MEQRFATEYLDEQLVLSPDHDTDEHDHSHPGGDHDSHDGPDTHTHHTPKGDRGYEGNRGSKDDTAQDDGSLENDHDLDDETIDT